LHHDFILLVQVVLLLELVDSVFVVDSAVVLSPVFSTEEDDCIFELVANPAFIVLTTDPLSRSLDLKVGILVVTFIEDKFRVT
jgi:hypothetical protein